MRGLLLMVAAAVVHFAKAGVDVTPPDGWKSSGEIAQTVLPEFDKNAKLPGLGADKILTGGTSFAAPDGTGVLHVLWLVGNGETADVPGLARTQLSAAMQRGKAAETQPGTVEIVGWKEDVGDKLASGTLEHRQTEWGTRTLARTLLFVEDNGHWHEVRLECVMRDDETVATTRPKCEAALASAVVTLPEASRRSLGQVPAQGTLAVRGGESEEDVGAAPAAPAEGQLETPKMSAGAAGAGDKVAPEERLPPGAPLPGEERRLSRFMLVGGGLCVILWLAYTMGRKRKPE